MYDCIRRNGAVVALVGAMLLAAPAFANQPEDAWITTKVKMSLLTDDVVGGLDINVDTFDGRVTLHGKAATEAEKMRAEHRAREIEGVSKVRNLIAVVDGAAREAVSIADDAIEKDVEKALSRSPDLANSMIGVKSVNDGVVVLSGKAETLSAHREALECAREVEGVRRVASEITSPNELGDREIYRDPNADGMTADAGRMFSDSWITTKAKLRLMAAPGLSPIAINVDTEDGVVTLFGIVGTESVKARAGAEIAKLDGVNKVENELQVVPDVAADRVKETDAQILEAINARLEAREALEDADIDVAVKNRVARLTGTVKSQRDRVTAMTIVRATGGVDSVIDDLRSE